MTTIVAILVVLLTLVVLGYSFNGEDGKIEQGGLLQLNSIPNGSIVTLDGLVLGSRTQTKSTVKSGQHNVSYELDGYRIWSKSIFINPGQVGWLDYARMIPVEIEPETIRTLSNVSGALASPKRSFILLSVDISKPVFELVDVRSDTVQYTTLELPAGSYTPPKAGETQSFAINSWSKNEDSILIKHTVGKTVEWIVLDRGDVERSLNITLAFDVRADTLTFGGGDNILYAKTGNVIRRIDIGGKSISDPLVTNAANFTVYDDRTIMYTTIAAVDGSRAVGYASVDMTQPRTLFTIEKSKKPLYAAMSSYFNRRYVAIVHGNDVSVYRGTLPTDDSKAETKIFGSYKLPSNALDFYISDNGRFVTAKLATGYAIYDIDLRKYDYTKWLFKPRTQAPLHWLDNFMLWSDYGGQLVVYDFDGANRQTIMPVTTGLAAVVSPNDSFLYGFLKTDKGYELRRVDMKL